MSKQYTTGGNIRRCPDCEIDLYDETEVRSYDPETGTDKLLWTIPAGEHPDNGCPRRVANQNNVEHGLRRELATKNVDFVAYDGYDAHANEIGSEDTLRKAKKIPGVVAIDAYDKRGRWLYGWELRNGRWRRMNQ